jgi:transglutaminase-like putative cysteine protease
VRSPEGRYWQAVVYDQYSGTAFQSSDTQRISINAREPLASEAVKARTILTQTFYTYFPNNTQIFAAPQPISINKPSWAESFSSGEIALWTTLAPISSGEGYQVVSAISEATAEQLRAAGGQYPPEVLARYLQLPDSLPDRVRELARRIVAGAKATNPYDQVSALELWLRTNIKYNNQINAPAPGQDGVDYVLFETRQGYCDYYASALAVMARSLGIPARVVTGYAEGEYDSNLDMYQVRQFNAHTWVEAYFPDYGWIQFEPTASQPAIARPLPTDNAAESAADAARNDELRRRGREGLDEEFDPNTGAALDALPPMTGSSAASQPAPGLIFAALTVGLLAAVAGGGFAAVKWYENRGTPPHAAGGMWAFARLAHMTRWLRLQISAADTPYEQAKTIGAAVPKRQDEIDQLADLYVRERYGRAEVDVNQTRSIWQRIHWSLWLAGGRRRLPRLLSRPQKWWQRLRR